jgi:hypothetical protein
MAFTEALGDSPSEAFAGRGRQARQGILSAVTGDGYRRYSNPIGAPTGRVEGRIENHEPSYLISPVCL